MARDYQRVEKAIEFIETHGHHQPSLASIAAGTGLSESHFQRLFSRASPGTSGFPGPPRAVGNAVGANPIHFLIPCHRVIRKMGEFGHFGGGTARKKAIPGWKAALGDRLFPV